jgi:Putative  PD-(D/E)XK family member, (DUF4420)
VTNYFSEFLSLPDATNSTEFKAIALNPTRKDYLAKTEGGSPVFLLHDSSAAKYKPSIDFRYLSAQFHTTCRVQTDAAEIEDQFCLVWCDAETPELYELFIKCVGAAIEELPDNCVTQDLESCISKLRDLFRSLALPNNREISGLWAELFVILNSKKPAVALSLWHEDPFDRFDFSSNSLRIEVKSTVRGIRAHEFALEQLQSPAQGLGLVVSMILQPLTGGLGVFDIAREIEGFVSHNKLLKQKLWANVAHALGADFSEKLDKRFDPIYAEKHLMVYSMLDIPKPDTPVDTRISALRFIADLSSVSTSLPDLPVINLRRIFFAY